MTFKVGNGQQSNPGPDVNRGNTPGSPNTQHRPEHAPATGNPAYSHDHTPTRQRELETHGNNVRSRVEGHSPGNSEWGHSHNPRHSNSSRSESGGIGLNLGAEIAGLDIEVSVGLRDTNNLLRETIRTVRHELNALPPESRGPLDLGPPGLIKKHNREVGDFRPDFRTDFHNGPRDANNFLRETIRTVRAELKELRSDSRGNSDHRPPGFTERHIESVLHIATRGFEDRLGRGERPERIARQLMTDVSGVVKLDEAFSRLERIGGEPVRRAYESVLNFALRIDEAGPNRLPLLVELLRDLNNGAFLHPRDMEGPFPLTGRARIVSEMMALMRTLDAIQKFTAQTVTAEVRADPYVKFNGDLSAFSLSKIFGFLGNDAVERIAQNLATSGPTLPGMAGRLEVLRLAAALNGILTDSAGRPLITADGLPLKLGELLWFNVRPDALVDLWSGDKFSSRFFPTLLHGGFDAVYSLIGFDGRSLSLPRFIAIQSQINSSEFEWLFGHAPFSEGWLRAMIEFLKDSGSFDHNVLGEILEEAVTTDRFHFAVMRGTVEEGRAVAGSFTFAPAAII